MRTNQSYQINFLSLLKKVSRLGNERNMKDIFLTYNGLKGTTAEKKQKTNKQTKKQQQG